MDNQEKIKEDLLTQYINSEGIEHAPDGFTANVMTRIQLETEPVIETVRLQNKNFVPVISSVVTIILILSAILIPGNQIDPLAKPVFELIKNIKISIPAIDISSIFSVNLPALLIYVFIGIFILTLFDRALYGLFHREKQTGFTDITDFPPSN
jgi:hypothetical protein